jgi:hypothetical protein
MVLATPALDGSRGPGRLHDMRSNHWAFLLGFGILFSGWLVLILIRPEGEALFIAPVVLGVIVALAARRPIALLGALVEFFAWYAVGFAAGAEFGDGWQGPAIIFPLLIASGFAGGLALLWLRAVRRAAVPS